MCVCGGGGGVSEGGRERESEGGRERGRWFVRMTVITKIVVTLIIVKSVDRYTVANNDRDMDTCTHVTVIVCKKTVIVEGK